MSTATHTAMATSTATATPTDTPTASATPAATATSTTATQINLLDNGDFEADVDNNGRPDAWSTNQWVTRCDSLVYGGRYAMCHTTNANRNYAVNQVVSNLKANAAYSFSGWINIPPTHDRFTFTVSVRWRDARNKVVRPSQLANYRGPTIGWYKVVGQLSVPPNATSAEVRMAVSSLNGTVYVDDFTLRN